MHKRASDLAAKLKPTPATPCRAFPPFRSSARRPFRGSRVRGFCGTRGCPRLPSFGRVCQPPSQATGRGASHFSFTSPPPPNDYPAPIPHEDRGPVGGRLSLFLSQWRRITDDAFVLSVVAHGYIISPLQDFPGVLRLKTVTPGNLLAQAKIEDEIASLLQKCAIVSRRSSSSFVVPDFRSSEKIRRPSRYFEPKKD